MRNIEAGKSKVFGPISAIHTATGEKQPATRSGYTFLRLFHRTTDVADIFTNGFSDGEGLDVEGMRRGVWLADTPYSSHDDAGGDVVEIHLPASTVVEFEVEWGARRHRHFLVPADLLNQFGPPEIFGVDLNRTRMEV